MNRPLTSPWFLIAGVAYLILLILKKTGVYFVGLSDYGADLLAMPVALSIALWVIRRSSSEQKTYRLSWTLIASGVVIFSVLFEGLFPLLSERFTADPIDVVAYALGAAFFAWKLNS